MKFININSLLVLSFKNDDDDPTRNSFDEYYMPLVEIKDFNAVTDIKPSFIKPVKNKQEVYEELVKMSGNDDYATGNVVYYLYYQKYCKLIGTDLTRQKKNKYSSTN